MDYLSLAALGLSALCTTLLILLLVQLRSLRAGVARMVERSSKSTSSSRSGDAGYEAVLSGLKEIEEQIGKFDIVFSDVQRQLAGLRQPPAAAPAPGPATARNTGASPPAFQPRAADPAPLPQTAATPPQPSSGVSAPYEDRSDLEQLAAEYRELIAQPRKTEINRWTEESGGWPCEIGEDGSIQPLGRDGGGLLVLLTRDDRRGIIVPGGRMVVDFPTSFSDVISMRRITRQSFELVDDGTGVLRLAEPAYAERDGGKWQIIQPGKLTGFKSD